MASPLVLSLSTVCALVGIVLVAVAFGTNNWREYAVDRANLTAALAPSDPLRQRLGRNEVYYSRVLGLFRKCFPENVPDGINSYYDPFGQNCVNIKDYRISSSDDPSLKPYDQLTEPERSRMHLMRSCVAFYIVGLAFLFACLLCGICGCWRRSTSLILSTGILLLFATLFLAAAMSVWHGIDYLEREVINQAPYFLSWEPILHLNTKQYYGWSYIIAWVGIFLVLLSSVLMLAAYRVMKNEEKDEFEKKRAPYAMSNYYDGSKGALVSPYNYQTYGYAYPAGGYGYPAYAQGTGANGYYGYLTYGR